MLPILSGRAIEIANHINAGQRSFGEKGDRPNNPSTIVFIDAAVADYQTLLDGVKLGVEAIILDSHRDGIEQISEVLANRTNIDSIHLVSHGEPGSLQLGKTRLFIDNLETYSKQLQQWQRALTVDADILIYGCNVAAESPAYPIVRQGINSLFQSESRLKPTARNIINKPVGAGSPTTFLVADKLNKPAPIPRIEPSIDLAGICQLKPTAYPKIRQGIHSLSHSKNRLKPTENNSFIQSSLEDFRYETEAKTPGGFDATPTVLIHSELEEPAVYANSFLHRLASLIDANIAASKHLTGSAKLGGNWELETKIGNIKSPLAFESDVMENYASVLATYSVTNTSDSGTGSLRNAIDRANSTPGLDTINFNIPGTGPHTITLGSQALPVINSPVIIDGKSQPGYAGKPIIELNGSFAQTPGSINSPFNIFPTGIELRRGDLGNQEDSSGSTIQGLVINGFGKVGFPPLGYGILVNSNNNTIQDNYIGTDISGTAAVGNTRSGIWIGDFGFPPVQNPAPVIGTIISRNVISGNTNLAIGGIVIPGPASNTRITGNYIGTDSTGTIDLGNDGSGIFLLRSKDTNNTIVGGTAPGEGNIIANNKGSGIEIIGNIGSHTIQGNKIFNNKALGIDLIGTTGVTPNDLGDADTGSNNLQNYPVLTSVSSNTVRGILNSTPNSNFRVEFFANTSYNSAGAGQGETFLGFQDVTTDSAGNANINFPYTPVTGKPFLAATATNKITGDTSEFSLRNRSPVNTVPGRITTAQLTLTTLPLIAKEYLLITF